MLTLSDDRKTIPVDAPSGEVLRGLREALERGETHYTDRPGMRALRERIAARLSEMGLTPERDADTVVVTAGESEARFVIELSGIEGDAVALGDALFRDPPPPFPAVAPDAILVGSLDALAGLRSFRVGFLSAPAELAPQLRSWKQALSICTAAPSQRAALLLLQAWKGR